MVSRDPSHTFVVLRPAYEALGEVIIVNFLDEGIECRRLPLPPRLLPALSVSRVVFFYCPANNKKRAQNVRCL